MAVTPVWNIEWLNANSQRAYPLSELVSRADTTGSMTIENDLLVDLSFVVPYSVGGVNIDPTLFHIYSIDVFSLGIIVAIGYNGAVAGMASVTDMSGKNKTYPVVGAGDFVGATGCVVIGSTAATQKKPGVYRFTAALAALEPTTIKPDIRSVSSLRVKNGTDTSAPLYGTVTLTAGNNIRLDVVDGETTAPTVVISAQVAEGALIGDCPCEPATSGALATINGIGPDASGNLALDGNACITVSGGSPVLSLTDTCSTPCCGCNELAVVTTDLATLATQAASMEQTVTTLEQRYTDLLTTLAASRLGIGTWA
jgi:hypothetical protein